jgi:hypothetical protein
MSTNGDQPQGVAGRSTGLRGWFRNLSRGAKIVSGILTTAATVLTIFIYYDQITGGSDQESGQGSAQESGQESGQGSAPPTPLPTPINAELTTPEPEFHVTRQAYLQDMNRPTKGQSPEELRELGMIVTADANIEGLQGKELTVGYSVYDSDKIRVPEQNNEEAQKIEPETQNDNERAKVFVPYPPEAGEYYVKLTLHDEDGEELDAVETPEPLFSPYAGPRPPEDPIKILRRLYNTDTMHLEQEEIKPINDDNATLEVQVPSGWKEVDQNHLQLGQGGVIVESDLSEKLQKQVPSGWMKVTQNYSRQLGQGGLTVGSGLAASPNFVSWLEGGWETSLAFVGASSQMMTAPPAFINPDPPALDYLHRSGVILDRACEREQRYNYAREDYLGHYDVWDQCGETDTDASIVNLVAWPEPASTTPQLVVVVTMYLSGKADIEAANAVLDSFNVLDMPISQTVSKPPPITESPNGDGQENRASGRASGTHPNPSREALAEKASVAAAVRGHYEAIGAGKFEEAYSYFGPNYKKKIDYNKQIWIKSVKREKVTDSTINSLTVNKVSENEASATVDVSFRDKRGTSRFELVWSLVKEGGLWKLDRQL